MKHSKENKMGLLALAVFFIAMNVSGCASHSKTVHTETVGNPPAQGVVVQQETTTSTTDHREYGILGGAFHVVVLPRRARWRRRVFGTRREGGPGRVLDSSQ